MAIATLLCENPHVQKVLSLLKTVGLKYSICDGVVPKGVAVILEGGVNLVKACRVPAFTKKVTHTEGLICCDNVEKRILRGRRALLAHVSDLLVSDHGAELISKELHHHYTVDEAYILKVGGVIIHLTLLPY